MSAAKKTVPFIVLGAIFFVSINKKNKSIKTTRKQLFAANSISNTGIIIKDGKLKVTDWNTWMRVGPHLIKMSLQEGNESPEEVAANVMRRLFPNHSWPSPRNDPFYATWINMVAMIGRAIDSPTQPHFGVVS